MFLFPCAEWIFAAEHPSLADRVCGARRTELNAADFDLRRDKDQDTAADALDETGAGLTGFVGEPRRSLVDPVQHDAFLERTRDSVSRTRSSTPAKFTLQSRPRRSTRRQA